MTKSIRPKISYIRKSEFIHEGFVYRAVNEHGRASFTVFDQENNVVEEGLERLAISENEIVFPALEERQEPFFGIECFMEETKLSIKQANNPIYTRNEFSLVNGTSAKPQWHIYHTKFGAGNPSIFIWSETEISLGDGSFFLEPLSYDEVTDVIEKTSHSAIAAMAKMRNINMGKTDNPRPIDETKEDLIRLQENTIKAYYKNKAPIEKEEFRGKNCLQLVLDILSHNLSSKDEILDYIYASQIPQLSTNRIVPRLVMPYSGHAIIITNSKVGKSTTGFMISYEAPAENVTPSNLVGFASADRRAPGLLHQRNKTLFIEEIQENQRDNIGGALLSYMEKGQSHQAKGAGGVNCEGTANIVFQGNPLTQSEEYQDGTLHKQLLVNEFLDTIEKITDNPKALGSRIAILAYGNKYKRADGVGLTGNQYIQAEKILYSLGIAFQEEFTALLTERAVIDWMNERHDDEYLFAIKELERSSQEPIIKDFLSGQLSNHRHLRGASIRLAWLEIGIAGSETNEIIKNAEKHYLELKLINLESFNRLSDTSNDIIQLLTTRKYETLPDYSKFFIATVFEAYEPGYEDVAYRLDMLETYFAAVKHKFDITAGKYNFWSGVLQKVKETKGMKTALEQFGLYLDRRNDTVLIKDSQRFSAQFEEYSSGK